MDRAMVVVGYARVSTEDQSTERQILDLEKFGCTEIFRENASGADRELVRPSEIIAEEAQITTNGIPNDAQGLRRLKAMGFSDKRLATLAARGMARLRGAAAVLGDQRAAAEFPRAARLVARAEPARPARVAGAGIVPREQRHLVRPRGLQHRATGDQGLAVVHAPGHAALHRAPFAHAGHGARTVRPGAG